MAQKVQVVLVDDLDGGPAEESVAFSVDGTRYEIDLSAANAEKFRAELAPWVAAARKVTARKGAARARQVDSGAVRDWARAHGYDVAERGRISTEIREAYAAAN